MLKGKFIVIYGANNLGKSTQAKMLVEQLKKQGKKAVYIKYPIYDLEPTGPALNAILREGKKLPKEEDLQTLFVQNRKDYQPKLIEMLDGGIWVVAEDYIGTGIAWGMVRGLKVENLEKLNQGLIKEDLAILLYGERFKEGAEKGHINEESEIVWEKGQEKHLKLAERYGWEKVKANGTVTEVYRRIIEIIGMKFGV